MTTAISEQDDPIKMTGKIIFDLRKELGDERWFELKTGFFKAIDFAEQRALERGHGSLKLHPMTTTATKGVSDDR